MADLYRMSENGQFDPFAGLMARRRETVEVDLEDTAADGRTTKTTRYRFEIREPSLADIKPLMDQREQMPADEFGFRLLGAVLFFDGKPVPYEVFSGWSTINIKRLSETTRPFVEKLFGEEAATAAEPVPGRKKNAAAKKGAVRTGLRARKNGRRTRKRADVAGTDRME